MIEDLLNSGTFQAIVLAGFITFFKSEVAKTIKTLWGYVNRIYPVGSKAELFNAASGHYEGNVVTVKKYVFSLNQKKGGVTFVDKRGKPERIGVLAWLALRKRPA